MNTSEKHFEKKDIQTDLKHFLLKEYLIQWGTILSNASFGSPINKVDFVDCFAGKGEFNDGKSGSPKIAMERLFETQQRFNTTYNKCLPFNINTIEIDKEYHDNLVKIKVTAPFPNQIHNFLGTFEENAPLLNKRTKMNPALYFIDPFGYKGLPMKTLAEIMQNKSHELLINVMSYSLVRNIKIDKSKDSLCEFFGIETLTEDLINYVELGANEQTDFYSDFDLKLEDKIIAFYKQQFRKACSEEIFLLSKRIHTKLNPNVYFHLVFITKDLQGLNAMKSAMITLDLETEHLEAAYAEENNQSKNIISDLFNDQIAYENYSYKNFLFDLYKHFPYKATLKEIATFFLENTPLSYRFKDDSNSIYGYLQKLVNAKKYCNKSTGGYSTLSRNNLNVTFNFNLNQSTIDYLVEQDQHSQLSLF
ncbi:three-Cys-motif partner protein TcmP [Solibacillus silvestris]|uniref:three-Cys-motif partner protein TcmP n=1 Tax=Solibacillus silvestris TaxID=76853 RepID=UPI003F80F8B9